jgi:hypothetical protein
LTGKQQARNPTGGKCLPEPSQAEQQVQGPHGLRRGERKAERKTIETPQGRADRPEQGRETSTLDDARALHQSRIVLPQATHRHRQPPDHQEQDEVQRAVGVQGRRQAAHR